VGVLQEAVTSAVMTSCTSPALTASSCGRATVAVSTDADCLGPCEPGTSVLLDGIVWSESSNGSKIKLFQLALDNCPKHCIAIQYKYNLKLLIDDIWD